MNDGSTILGAILAGGQSRRMGCEKAFVMLDERPMLDHVVSRFRPQVDRLVINANGAPGRFAAWGCPVVADDASSEGPLSGVLAVLGHAQVLGFDLVATVPCDAPLLPDDLVQRLHQALDDGHLAAIAETPNGLEPLFGLWRTELVSLLEAALSAEVRAVHRFVAGIPHAKAVFTAPSQTPDPFWNLNTPDMLAKAQVALQTGGASLYTSSSSQHIDQGS